MSLCELNECHELNIFSFHQHLPTRQPNFPLKSGNGPPNPTCVIAFPSDLPFPPTSPSLALGILETSLACFPCLGNMPGHQQLRPSVSSYFSLPLFLSVFIQSSHFAKIRHFPSNQLPAPRVLLYPPVSSSPLHKPCLGDALSFSALK